MLENAVASDLSIKAGVCSGVLLDDGRILEGDFFVFCTGATPFSGFNIRQLTMEPTRGQVIVARNPIPWLQHMVYVDALDIIQRDDGLTLIGATCEIGQGERAATVGGIASLLARLSNCFTIPDSLRFERTTVGIRPRSPSEMPVVGLCGQAANLVVFNGLYRNGVILSAALAGTVARCCADGRWERLEPFLVPFSLD